MKDSDFPGGPVAKNLPSNQETCFDQSLVKELRSLTRDQTHAPCVGSMESTTGPSGKSPALLFLKV